MQTLATIHTQDQLAGRTRQDQLAGRRNRQRSQHKQLHSKEGPARPRILHNAIGNARNTNNFTPNTHTYVHTYDHNYTYVYMLIYIYVVDFFRPQICGHCFKVKVGCFQGKVWGTFRFVSFRFVSFRVGSLCVDSFRFFSISLV